MKYQGEFKKQLQQQNVEFSVLRLNTTDKVVRALISNKILCIMLNFLIYFTLFKIRQLVNIHIKKNIIEYNHYETF